jgi:hypothetical protein
MKKNIKINTKFNGKLNDKLNNDKLNNDKLNNDKLNDPNITPVTPSDTSPATPNNKIKQCELIQYNLLNVENYNDTIRYDLHDILDKYVLLITEYMIFLNEKINIKNKNYFQYIFTRGIDTITNVFNGMLFYTKNLDLSFYHSQKAFYYYVEFIEQITETQNIFLKLSSRDAAMFVYKRSLFEINHEYIKTTLTQPSIIQEKMKLLNIYCETYKSISSFFINNNFKYENKSDLISSFALKLTTVGERLNYLIMDLETLNQLLMFINQLSNTDADTNLPLHKYFEIIEAKIKKISKGQLA